SFAFVAELVATAGELVGQLQRRQGGDGVSGRSFGGALDLADLRVHQIGKRLHIRFFGVALDGVALAGNGHGDGPFQVAKPS
ncbi:MAG TPA: hypothetical protein VIA18_02040, partial [Polyangia bacterium]|nr:hypothetical protein [Polyangia bacterium]